MVVSVVVGVAFVAELLPLSKATHLLINSAYPASSKYTEPASYPSAIMSAFVGFIKFSESSSLE